MTFKVNITDDNGEMVFSGIVEMDNLLDAGIAGEHILDKLHLEHPEAKCCNKCIHHLRVLFSSMKGGEKSE